MLRTSTENGTSSARLLMPLLTVDQDIIPGNSNFSRQFLDLLKKIFVYDPAKRITAKQALQHPWFNELANPDDGTEAAKIRTERIRIMSRERATSNITAIQID